MRDIKFREEITYKIDDWYITTDITRLRADSKGWYKENGYIMRKVNNHPKHKKENINASKIIRKQNLMINAMAEYISNSDNDEIICKATKCEDEGCKNCIKQYFEKEVTE